MRVKADERPGSLDTSLTSDHQSSVTINRQSLMKTLQTVRNEKLRVDVSVEIKNIERNRWNKFFPKLAILKLHPLNCQYSERDSSNGAESLTQILERAGGVLCRMVVTTSHREHWTISGY